MTRGQTKAAWIFGLLAGAVGVGGVVYYVTRPKALTQGSGGASTASGGGGSQTVPLGPVNNAPVYNPPAPPPNPYGTYQGAAQGSYGAYLAANSQLISPTTGNA